MTMKRVLIFPLLAIALLGLGCKKPATKGESVPNASSPADAIESADGQTATPVGVSRDILYARQVLRNLNQAKSFRAAMLVPSASGVINTTLDYDRADGLVGKVTIPTAQGSQTAELYANENEIWFKDGSGTKWNDLSNTQEGRTFNAIFQNAFGYQSQYQSTISDTAVLAAKEQDPNASCLRYTFRQNATNGTEQLFTLCASADLPVYLTINGPFGQIEIRYSNVNGNVVVKKPV